MALGDGMKMGNRTEDTLSGLSSLLGQFKRELRAEVDSDVRALSAKVDALQRMVAAPQVTVQAPPPANVEVYVPDPPDAAALDLAPLVASNKKIETMLSKLLTEIQKPVTRTIERDANGMISEIRETR